MVSESKAAEACGALVWAITGFLLSSTAQAEQWFTAPRASLGSFYDDNVRLAETDPQETFAFLANATLTAGRRTELSEIGLGVDVSSIWHSAADDLDHTDVALSLTSGYQWNRHRFGLGARYDYDSTLTSEVSTSGLVQENQRRSRVLLNPSWQYRLSERATLETTLRYDDVAYEDTGSVRLYDYDFTQLAATTSYALSERLKLLSRVSYDHYDADRVQTDSDSYGVELGAGYLISETMSVNTFAGLRQTLAKTPNPVGAAETDTTGPLFQVELRNQAELGELSISAMRAMLPSSNGSLLDTTGLTFAFTRPLSQTWSVHLNAEGYRNQSTDSGSSGDNRRYVALTPALSHRLAESWSLDLSYRYRWQSYEVNADEATSNALYLTVNYKLPQEPVSRWSLFGGD
jgi:hypothetical protein